MDTEKSIEIDLGKLALIDVLNLMVRSSGRSWEEVGELVGWGMANLGKIRDPGQNYWPTLPMIPKFCAHTKSELIVDWLHVQAKAAGLLFDTPQVDCQTLVAALGRLFADMGKLAEEGGEAVADSKLELHEVRALLRCLLTLVNEALGLLGGLRANADCALSGRCDR